MSPSSAHLGKPRERSFSTFPSAFRVDPDSGRDFDRMKLSDIVAGGQRPLTAPEEFTADQAFLRRMVHLEFNLYRSIRGMRALFCRSLEAGLYEKQKIGEPIGNEICMLPNIKSVAEGDRNPYESPGNPQIMEEIVYFPEGALASGPRHLYAFFVHGEEGILMLKARADLVSECDAERLEYIKRHMAERDERIQSLAQEITVHNSMFGSYDSRDVGLMLYKNQRTAMPPVRYLLGAKDALLSFRCLEPVNKESIVANLIMVVTNVDLVAPFASNLSTCHPIRVVLMELRGFGYSGGKRGHTPTVASQFSDISRMVRHVKDVSDKPILLGGYTFAGAIILNYDRYKAREPVDGYIALSPILGIRWRYAWKDELRQSKKRKILDIHTGWLTLARITGGRIGGSRYVIELHVSDKVYEFSPLLFNRMTANFVLSFQVSRSFFRKGLSAPLAVFGAENDEFLKTDVLRDSIEPHLKGESRFFYKANQTGLGMLMTAADEVAKWILSLEVVKRFKADAQVSSRAILTPSELTSLRTFIPVIVYEGIRRGIENRIYDSKLQGADNHGYGYDYWEPSYLPGRPNGVLLMLVPRCEAFWLPAMAETYRLTLFRMDPWQQTDGSKTYLAPRMVWRALKHLLRIIRANHPATPLFVGGVGYGASLALGYIQGGEHGPINGCILIDPPLDTQAKENGPWLINDTSGPERPDLSTFMFGEPPISQKEAPRSQKKAFEDAGYVVPFVKDPECLLLSKDLVGEIKNLQIPTVIFLPTEHPYLKTASLFGALERELESPDKQVSCLSGNLGQLLAMVGQPLGKWVLQMSGSAASQTPLVLSDTTSLLDFEPIEMIGKGPYSKVWLVRHSQSNRFLALKVMEKTKIVLLKQVKQVMREKELLRECGTCPFIVDFVGSFQDSQRLFLAMEFLVGGELFLRMREVGPFSVDQVRFYVSEVLVALTFMHERDIVYRNLKPENLVLDAMGHVRLVDLGLARRLQRGRCNSFCGSPYYIAPEVLSTSTYGRSVDCWALGVLIYEMLVGSPPFGGRTANEVYKNILSSTFEIPSKLDADSADLIKRLLDPSPETRLGCKDVEGVAAVAKHHWFRDVDWDSVKKKRVPPPFQPAFTFEGDTTNFIKFTGSILDTIDEGPAPFQKLFRGY